MADVQSVRVENLKHEEREAEASRLSDSQPSEAVEVRETEIETLTVNKQSDKQPAGGVVNTDVKTNGEDEIKKQVGVDQQQPSTSVTDNQMQNQPQVSVCPASSKERCPNSVGEPVSSGSTASLTAQVSAGVTDNPTQNQPQMSVCPASSTDIRPNAIGQPVSSASNASLTAQRLSPPKSESICTPETGQQYSCSVKAPTVVRTGKASVSDGYNWRKYGQKQVKSPTGSRSYYKCTHSDCFAKKIEFCDHSGHIIEIVCKGEHSHDPPPKANSTRENRRASSTVPVVKSSGTEHPIRMLNDQDISTSSKEPPDETFEVVERKQKSSAESGGDGDSNIKEEDVNIPESKKRLNQSNSEYPGPLSKPGKKPKLVVHAAGDVGISGDGYRWRKYGQKMVKGNPHPRNYYRCTSAGCPVRKHIETAVDNTDAVIITYKGVHDHDMPVPKKRHGPPSAPLVAAAAPASMNNMQLKKSDSCGNQISSTQWSVDKGGELSGEALDLGGEKAIESARTLLSIGFEIKPC